MQSHLADRIVELVDRRADGDDHRSGDRDVRRRRCEHQPVTLERSREQGVSAILDERQSARLQCLEHVAIDVVHVDAKARLGKSKHQGDADMAAATDNGQVGRVEVRGGHRRRLGTGKIHSNSSHRLT
jgi:hypothetical protein